MTEQLVKKQEAVFAVVVFPGIEQYLPQFVASLVHQTCHKFDLCIFNDGLAPQVVCSQFAPLEGIVHFNVINIAGTPASIRVEALNFLISQKYEKAILGDSDDFFSENRVQVCLALLDHYDVVINDLNITDSLGEVKHRSFLSSRLEHKQLLTEEFLVDKNVCGFSNSAINLQKLGPFDIDEHVLATDWYLFTYALCIGLTMVFSADAQTFYRQHEANYVGVGEISLNKIKQATRIKYEHYTGLIPLRSSYSVLASKYAGLNMLIEALSTTESDAIVIEALGVDKTKTNLFWWEVI